MIFPIRGKEIDTPGLTIVVTGKASRRRPAETVDESSGATSRDQLVHNSCESSSGGLGGSCRYVDKVMQVTARESCGPCATPVRMLSAVVEFIADCDATGKRAVVKQGLRYESVRVRPLVDDSGSVAKATTLRWFGPGLSSAASAKKQCLMSGEPLSTTSITWPSPFNPRPQIEVLGAVPDWMVAAAATLVIVIGATGSTHTPISISAT